MSCFYTYLSMEHANGTCMEYAKQHVFMMYYLSQTIILRYEAFERKTS